jgi:hypothetical protein
MAILFFAGSICGSAVLFFVLILSLVLLTIGNKKSQLFSRD